MASSIFELRISNADDRLTVGAILLKNGYTVELDKTRMEGRKSQETILRASRKEPGL